MKVLALIEHVDRELDFVAAVKHLAAREGVTLEVRQFYADAPLLLAGEAPRIVLTPFFYAADDLTLRDYVRAWPDTAFFNLAWEQLFYPAHQKLKAPRDKMARERVTHLAWTEQYRDFLAAHRVAAENVRLTGHGVYGLLDEPYRRYFPDRAALAAKHELDPAKPWVFVPENYRWAFFTDYKLRGMSRRGVARDDLFDMRAYCRRGLVTLAHWCEALASRGDAEVIVRPRPATSVDEISRFFAAEAGLSAPGFRMIKAETAREWSLASDAVVSSYSTVQIEAALAGKRVLRIAPEPAPAALRYDWSELVAPVRTQAEFLDACLGDEGAPGPLAEWARNSFFAAGDPIAAAARAIVSATRAAYDRPPPRTRAKRLPAALHEAVLAAPDAEARDALFRERLRSYSFNRGTHEKDLFEPGDVEARVARWADILG